MVAAVIVAVSLNAVPSLLSGIHCGACRIAAALFLSDSPRFRIDMDQGEATFGPLNRQVVPIRLLRGRIRICRGRRQLPR